MGQDNEREPQESNVPLRLSSHFSYVEKMRPKENKGLTEGPQAN